MKHIKETVQEYKNYKEELKSGKPQGLLTPYRNLNTIVKNGLPWNTVTTIAALSGVGKTALLTNICFAAPVLNKNTVVLLFTLEMSGRSIVGRRISSLLRKTTKDIEAPEFDLDDELLENIINNDIYIDEEGGTPDAVYNKIDAFIKKYDSNTTILIGFDHSLLVDGVNENEKMARFTALINKLKLKYSNSNYIILSQLNDSVLKEERLNKKGLLLYPMYTDLAYGRDLFRVSDTVIAMNNPSVYIDEELDSTKIKRYQKEYGGLPLFLKKNGINEPIIYGHIIKGRSTGTGIISWGSELKHNILIETDLLIKNN
jgi:KaiC/GvpD/RAD55 family RecA-like ATPase